jgi:hypothetical protein
MRAPDHERVDPGVRGRHDAVVTLQPGRTPRPGERTEDPWFIAMERDHGLEFLSIQLVDSCSFRGLRPCEDSALSSSEAGDEWFPEPIPESPALSGRCGDDVISLFCVKASTFFK